MLSATIPPRVDYELEPVSSLGLWARNNRAAVAQARERFDAATQD
jgi:hypothetical protein